LEIIAKSKKNFTGDTKYAKIHRKSQISWNFMQVRVFQRRRPTSRKMSQPQNHELGWFLKIIGNSMLYVHWE